MIEDEGSHTNEDNEAEYVSEHSDSDPGLNESSQFDRYGSDVE